MLDHKSLTTHELREGMIVFCHGMRCLIDHPIQVSKGHDNTGPGGEVRWTDALVLNRDDVSPDSVPLSFTAPRLPGGRTDMENARDHSKHRWGIQGNAFATWAVETASIPKD